MQLLFVGVFVLTAVLVMINIHEVIPRFVEDKSRPKVIVYLGTLFCLGYLVIHLAYRVIEFAQLAQDSGTDYEQTAPRRLLKHPKS